MHLNISVIHVTVFIVDLLNLLLLFLQANCNTGLIFPLLFFLNCYAPVVNLYIKKSEKSQKFYCYFNRFVVKFICINMAPYI